MTAKQKEQMKIDKLENARFEATDIGELKPLWWFLWQTSKIPALLIHEFFHLAAAVLFLPFGAKIYFLELKINIHADEVDCSGSVGTGAFPFSGFIIAIAPALGWLLCNILFAYQGMWWWLLYFQISWWNNSLSLSNDDLEIATRCLNELFNLSKNN